jgi:hypothetical protein
MRKLPVVIAILQFGISGAAAQSQVAASKAELLSLDQETRISQLIAQQAAPLSRGSFSIALDALVSAEIQIHSLQQRRNNWRRNFAASATSSSKS